MKELKHLTYFEGIYYAKPDKENAEIFGEAISLAGDGQVKVWVAGLEVEVSGNAKVEEVCEALFANKDSKGRGFTVKHPLDKPHPENSL